MTFSFFKKTIYEILYSLFRLDFDIETETNSKSDLSHYSSYSLVQIKLIFKTLSWYQIRL